VKKFKSIALMGTMLAVAGMSAVGPAHAEKILRYTSVADAATMDPHALNAQTAIMVASQIYDGLVMRDPGMKKVPALAESWTLINPTTWEFKLRKGVKFHNGNDFNADDVVFTIGRTKAPTSQMKGYVNTVDEVKKIDDYTVHFITSKPSPVLLDQLINIFIMDKEWSEEHNVSVPQNFKEEEETYAVRNANGTGAFKLESREPDVKTVFRRNPAWWGHDINKSNVDKVVWTPITNAATRVGALLSGEVDLLTDMPVQDLKRVEDHADLKVMSTPQIRTIFYGLDVKSDTLRNSNIKDHNPFKKLEVRKAIYHAINIKAIRKVVMRNLSVPAGMMIQPAVNGYNEQLDTQRLAYDPGKAKELLATAGYPDGFSVQLDCPNNRYQNDEAICQATVGMLAKVGIKTQLNSQPKTQHFPLITGRKTDFYMLGWGIPTMDSGFIFDYLLHSKGSWNASGYGSAATDAKIEEIRGIVDPVKRNKIIADIWSNVNTDIPYVPLHHQVISWGASKKLDIPLEPNNMPRFYWANLK
jgi:peptide/nickel transport system substrate-binding protein